MNTYAKSFFKDPSVTRHLSELRDNYVVVPADKALNNIVFACKSRYIDFLIKELGIDSSLGSQTYTPTTLTKRGNP